MMIMGGKKKMRMKPNPFSSDQSSINKPSPSSSTSCSSSSSPSSSSSTATWPWPPYSYYCHQQPRTLSFRTTASSADKPISTMSKPTDSPTGPDAVGPGPGKPDASFDDDPAAVETVIRGLKQSDRRRFFSPGETSSSILREHPSTSTSTSAAGKEEEEEQPDRDGGEGDLLYPFKDGGAGAVAMTLDSRDPFEDFKKSMAEMVEAHGLRDWESLEQLLSCYLKVNGKSNHGYIVGAFVDLLGGLKFLPPKTTAAVDQQDGEDSNCSCSHDRRQQHYSPSSPLSFYTSFSSSSSSEDSSSTPCVSSLEAYREAAEGDELEIEEEISTACAAPFRGEKERERKHLGPIN